MSEYITKDSGQRESFDSGMVRDTRDGKGRFDLITPIGLRRLAQVYERGAAKYADRNWEKGSPFGRFLDSAERHINDYKAGLRDEDHLAQAAWNLFSIMHLEHTKPELQDLKVYRTSWSDEDFQVRADIERLEHLAQQAIDRSPLLRADCPVVAEAAKLGEPVAPPSLFEDLFGKLKTRKL